MLTGHQVGLPTNLPGVLTSPQSGDRVTVLEAQVQALVEHQFRLMEAIQGYADLLNRDGALDIVQARITASHGIIFPATQNASTDANTLDDYEEGTWTPVLTFVTPGDLAVTYGARYGDYEKIGRQVTARLYLDTASFTHTTASGNLTVTGLPFAATATSNFIAVGGAIWRGITKANYTDVVGSVSAGATAIGFAISGSGQSATSVAAADMPTGGTVLLCTTITYRV